MYKLEILCSNLMLLCLDCVASDYLSRKEDPVALSRVPIVRTAHPHKISYSLASPLLSPLPYPFLLPFPFPSSPTLSFIFVSSPPLQSLCFYPLSSSSSSPFLSSFLFPPPPFFSLFPFSPLPLLCLPFLCFISCL